MNMTPPEAPVDGKNHPGDKPPAASVCAPDTLTVLKKRSDFLKAARARRQGTSSMMVQGRKRAPDEDQEAVIRVGFTCSKKVGNAVARNRAKRRLREAARAILPEHGRAGWDYVLIGRAGSTSDRPYSALLDDLRYALRKIHGAQK